METLTAYNSIHDGPAIDAAVTRASEGGAIDAAIQAKPNPNLLDNWYFGNPVNQRGQTEYTSAGYTIDRWKLPGAHKMELADNGLKITCNASATVNHCLAQVVEGLRTGLTYTLSALIVENTTANGVNLRVGNDPGHVITGTGLFSWTFVASGATDLLNSPGMQFNGRASDGDNYFVVLAMKLELGSQQTLAHQDADGNWVINELPNYGDQLLRCQRYFVNFNPYKQEWFAMPTAVASNSYHAYSAVTLPVAMRTKPSVSFGGNIVLSQANDNAVTAITVSDNTFTGNSIQLRYDVGAGGLTANSLYRVQGHQDSASYIHLSADL